MTPAEHARWTQEWEEYVEIMERLRDRDAATIEGFRETLREIRGLPEVTS